jgi:hypothetical protein
MMPGLIKSIVSDPFGGALDRHGNTHFLRTRAAPGAPAMEAGARVLIVDRADAVYVAVPAAPDL